jgi:outer membrane receptor protein involved in Fe transport
VPTPGSALDATVNTSIISSQTYNNRSELFKLAYNFSTTTSLTAGFYGSQSLVDYTGSLASVEPYTIVGECASCGNGNTFNNPQFNNLIGKTVLASNGDDDLFSGNAESDNEPIFTLDLRSAIGPGTFLGRYYAGAIDRLIGPDPGELTQITSCLNPACNPASFTGDENFAEDETDQLHGGDFQYNLPIGVSSLTLGYDSHNDRSTFCDGNAAAPLTCSSNGLLIASNTFSLRGFIPILPKLTLGFANYFSDTTFVGHRYDPSVTLVYRPSRRQSIRFAAGTAFVAPFSGFVGPVAGANGSLSGVADINGKLDVVSNLKPETSQTFDLGTDYATGHDSKVTLDLYNTILANRFQSDSVNVTGGDTATFNGAPVTSIDELFNQSNSHEQGIEFGFLKAPRVGFGTSIAFELAHDYDFNTVLNPLQGLFSTLSPSSNLTGGFGEIKDNTQIPGYAYSKGHAEVNYTFKSTARVAFGMSYYGDYNSFGQPAFELFDANVGIPLQDGFRLHLSGINLFNHNDGLVQGEFDQGSYTPIAAPGQTTSPVSLFFAPPRQVTLQLSHPL